MKIFSAIKILCCASCFVFFLFLTSCFKEEVMLQVEMQENLISPVESGKCWTLTRTIEKEEYKYYLKYYTFETALNQDKIALSYENTIYYQDKVVNKKLLTADFIDRYWIDNDPDDCSSDLDVIDNNHVFFRTSDYTNFGRKTQNVFSSNSYTSKLSDATNPSIKDTTFYYYEELYFERNGRFKKKIFMNTGCNAIEISGNWIFRTPFANINSSGISETEIILNYDHAPIIGLPPSGNIYKLTCNAQELTLKQNTFESDSSFLALRGHYSIIIDHIYYNPGLFSIHWSHISPGFEPHKNGMVLNRWSQSCTYIDEKPNDKIEIHDPLDLIIAKVHESESNYQLQPIRCTAGSTPCPKFCELDLCGNFDASVYDSDDEMLVSTYKSDITVTSDSTKVTITNFANTGQPITIKTQKHQWGICYFYDSFTTVLDGTTIMFVSMRAKTFKGTEMLYVECQINGTSRLIHYVLQ